MKKQSWLLNTTLILCLVISGATFARQPNLVIFLVDDMGWMDSGAYGSQYYETPNIDRLAQQSMRFTDAYALPLCSPTRASIMTGQYSARHRVTSATGHRPAPKEGYVPYPTSAKPGVKLIYANSKNYLDLDFTTLAEVLKEAGYRTGHFGKWHLGLMPEHRPDKHGFETTWGCAPDPGPPSYFSPYNVSPDGDNPTGQNRIGNITDGPDGEHIADRLADEAIKFIKTHKNEPFYLNLWQYSVHGPWQHQEEYTAEFARKKDPTGRQNNPVMASMLRSMDESLGRVLKTLDELGLTQDTLFIFMSDNGGNTHSWSEADPKIANITEEHRLYDTITSYRKWAGGQPPTSNAPLREGKGRIYEGGQRVPLMVRWPGFVKPGTVSDALVGAIDIYPTVLDALKLKKPADHIVDGISFLPVLENKGKIDRGAYFTWFPHIIPAVSVRSGDWKLIRRWESNPRYPELYELYNLKDDIGENKNLAEKMPEKVKELDALINNFIKDTGALEPIPNPAYRGPVLDAGLVPKSSKATVIPGAYRVEAEGKGEPFIGTAAVRFKGPIKFNLRVRSPEGGKVVLRWITMDADSDFMKNPAVELNLPAGNDWHDLEGELPVDGVARIIRLYLPAAQSPVDIEHMKFFRSTGEIKAWNFN